MQETSKSKSPIRTAALLLIGIAIGLVIAFMEPPVGLTPQSMQVLGILGGAVFYLASGVLPEMVTVILMGFLFVMFAEIPMSMAFGGFASTVAWLFLVAMVLAFVLANSGLVRRISLWLLNVLPASYFGQMLAVFLSGFFVIGPTIPSLAGKMALFTPVVHGVIRSMGLADNSKGSIGLIFAAFIAPYILAGVAFLTGTTPNLIVYGALPEAIRLDVPWLMWTVYALPMTIIVGVGMFLVLMKMYSPGPIEVKREAMQAELANMGPMSAKEKIVGLLTIIMFVLFVTGPLTGIDPAHSAIAILLALFILEVVTPKDMIAAVNWPIWIFLAFILQIAPVLAKVEVDKWLGTVLTPVFQPLAGNPYLFFLVLLLVGLAVRMISPSISAAGVMLLVAVSPVATAMGINPFLLVLAYATVGNHWIMPHLNATGYLVQYALVDGKVYTHAQGRTLCYIFLAVSVIAVMLSIPYWQWVGLIR